MQLRPYHMANMFRAIASKNFEPFGQLRLEFPPVPDKPENLAEVHLFTGVNGTGKTRILSVLSAMLGNTKHLLKRMKGGQSSSIYATSRFPATDNFERWGSYLVAGPTSVGWQHVGGDFIQKHQEIPAFAYSGYAYVTDAPVSAMGAVQKPDRNECLSFNRPEQSSHLLLQAVTNLLFEAAVDSLNVSPESTTHSRSARLVKLLEATIFEITGTKFQFRIEKFPQISLFVVWGKNKLPFDVLPDGLRAIIGWLVHALVMMDVWLQGQKDPTDVEAIFLLDEIESHLHPAWQRKILPAFQRLFPKSQIFVATHSPFVIASLNHGWIHSLKMEANGQVIVEKPKAASKGDSYISVVEEIMGVKEWFDPETEKLLKKFRSERDLIYGEKTPEERVTLFESVKKLALEISSRSEELGFIMGKELNQLERHLAKGT